MVWLFPESPRYAGAAEPPPAPPKKGCSFWMFGLSEPNYSTSSPAPAPAPGPPPPATRLAIDIICPPFPEDTNGRGAKQMPPMDIAQPPGLLKGMPATVAVPSGVTRYRFWYGPATLQVPDASRLVPCWPVAADEPASGIAPAGALFITPTWARHPGTGPIAPSSVRATVFIEFE